MKSVIVDSRSAMLHFRQVRGNRLPLKRGQEKQFLTTFISSAWPSAGRLTPSKYEGYEGLCKRKFVDLSTHGFSLLVKYGRHANDPPNEEQ